MLAVIDLLAAKANCDLFISAVLFLCCCCALSCCIVVCCCCVVLCCVVTYFAVLSHILLLGVCEFLALLRQPNGAVRVCCVVLRCAVLFLCCSEGRSAEPPKIQGILGGYTAAHGACILCAQRTL